MFRRSVRGIVFSGSRKPQNRSFHRKGHFQKNREKSIVQLDRFFFDRILLDMRGSEIDKWLKNSIILELATKGGTDFILPDGTFKLMADKYKVKVDTRKRQREMAIFEDPLLDEKLFLDTINAISKMHISSPDEEEVDLI